MTKKLRRLLKSLQNYIGKLPLQTKLFFILIPIITIDIFSSIYQSPVTILIASSLVLASIFAVAKTDYKRFLIKEKKQKEEDELFNQIEKSLASLQDAVEDIHHEKEANTPTDDDNQFKIPVPDCAVIIGKNNTASYLIPYNLDQLAHHELTALEAASNLLKKKGFAFQILKYKQNHPFFQMETKVKVTQDQAKALQPFPINFINYN